jgi:starvation-inducible DNA-binding protein
MSTVPTIERHQAASLNALLADLIGLQLLAKHGLWNVVEPAFRDVHLILDDVADAARQASESLAERLRALRLYPDGLVSAVAASGLPTLDGGPMPDVQAAAAFDALLGEIGGRLRTSLETIQGDTVTQDVLTACLGELDKQAWLIRAHGFGGTP